MAHLWIVSGVVVVEVGEAETWKVLNLMQEYLHLARLTFSNSLLKEEHLSDKICNDICSLFAQTKAKKKQPDSINIQKCINGKLWYSKSKNN